MEPWTILLTVSAILIALYYLYGKENFFVKHGILYYKSPPIIGTVGDAFIRRIPIFDYLHNIYNMNKDAKYVGFFDFSGKPIVMLRDPELIRTVTVKNFDHFVNHRPLADPTQEPLFSNNLFLLQNNKWREIRNLLSPAFTSSKMKAMFKLMLPCASEFSEFLVPQSQDQSFEIDAKDAFTRYTNDVIATCAFGIAVDSMRDRDNEFYRLGRKATNLEGIRSLKFLAVRAFPKLSKLFGLRIVATDVEKFFTELVRDTIATRDEKGITRPDMIQLMMETRNGHGPQLTIEEMVSQAFVFFFAGFDSTSRVMCFAAHEIAANPKVQEKLQSEIDDVYKMCDGEPTYEAINSMVYLNAAVNETLRLYSAPGFLDRVCNNDFELPPALPDKKPVLLKSGDIVWVPVYSLHRDTNYYNDPYVFSPERFTNEVKADSGHSMYYPFGSGPRMCIGNRFALLEIKVVLFYLLQKFNLKPGKKMILPMKFTVGSVFPSPQGGFWLEVSQRVKSDQVEINK